MENLNISLWSLILLIVVALAFDFMNGFHDGANSISTIVATGALTPKQAVLFAAFFNFAALWVFQLRAEHSAQLTREPLDALDHHLAQEHGSEGDRAAAQAEDLERAGLFSLVERIDQDHGQGYDQEPGAVGVEEARGLEPLHAADGPASQHRQRGGVQTEQDEERGQSEFDGTPHDLVGAERPVAEHQAEEPSGIEGPVHRASGEQNDQREVERDVGDSDCGRLAQVERGEAAVTMDKERVEDEAERDRRREQQRDHDDPAREEAPQAALDGAQHADHAGSERERVSELGHQDDSERAVALVGQEEARRPPDLGQAPQRPDRSGSEGSWLSG